jgi:hypothetical protein
MMCHPSKHLHFTDADLCGCGCGPSFRHFRTKDEKKEMLEKYRDQLKQEIAGIDEYIDDLEKK